MIWSNECRSGKCGIDDDQRGHLPVLHLVDVGLVLVGELLVVPLKCGVNDDQRKLKVLI